VNNPDTRSARGRAAANSAGAQATGDHAGAGDARCHRPRPLRRGDGAGDRTRLGQRSQACSPGACGRTVVRAVTRQAMSKKFKILLAEDEPSMRRYVQMIMSRWDCELAVEVTGAEAINRAATFKPDVALIGYCTPGMDGAQAGINLLKVSGGTQIVLFNESVPADMLSELRAQGYDFRTLAAPFDAEELRTVCFPSSHPEAG
jgi:CheY-like chemotaxis protein